MDTFWKHICFEEFLETILICLISFMVIKSGRSQLCDFWQLIHKLILRFPTDYIILLSARYKRHFGYLMASFINILPFINVIANLQNHLGSTRMTISVMASPEHNQGRKMHCKHEQCHPRGWGKEGKSMTTLLPD